MCAGSPYILSGLNSLVFLTQPDFAPPTLAAPCVAIPGGVDLNLVHLVSLGPMSRGASSLLDSRGPYRNPKLAEVDGNVPGDITVAGNVDRTVKTLPKGHSPGRK